MDRATLYSMLPLLLLMVLPALVIAAVSFKLANKQWHLVIGALLATMLIGIGVVFSPHIGVTFWISLALGAYLGIAVAFAKFVTGVHKAVAISVSAFTCLFVMVMTARVLVIESVALKILIGLAAGAFTYYLCYIGQSMLILERKLSKLYARFRGAKVSHKKYQQFRLDVLEKLTGSVVEVVRAAGSRYRDQVPNLHAEVGNGRSLEVAAEALHLNKPLRRAAGLGGSQILASVEAPAPELRHMARFADKHVMGGFTEDRKARSAPRKEVYALVDLYDEHFDTRNPIKWLVLKCFFPTQAMFMEIDKHSLLHLKAIMHSLGLEHLADELELGEGDIITVRGPLAYQLFIRNL